MPKETEEKVPSREERYAEPNKPQGSQIGDMLDVMRKSPAQSRNESDPGKVLGEEPEDETILEELSGARELEEEPVEEFEEESVEEPVEEVLDEEDDEKEFEVEVWNEETGEYEWVPESEFEAEGEEEPTSEVAQLKAEIEDLKSQISSEKSAIDPEKLPQLEVDDLFDEDAFEQVLSEPDAFREALKKTSDHAVTRLLKTLPGVVNKAIERGVQQHMASFKFYQANPELENHRDVVATIANRLHGEHPDWDTSKLFQETAKEAKRQLKSRKSAKATDDKSVKRKRRRRRASVAKTPKGTRKRRSEKLSGQDKEIAEMLDHALNR